MRRSPFVFVALLAAPTVAVADDHPGVVDMFTTGVVRAGRAILDGPEQLATDLVQFQIDLRDALHSVQTWLVAWSGQAIPVAPDLTALTASPLPGVESSGFGWRDDPVRRRNRKFHKGTDFRAERGTPVHAAGDGLVVFTGRKGGYGNCIFIDHGGGIVTRYAHLSKIEIHTGDHVVATDLIGKVGSTGRTTGPHLHFEVRIDGRAVDPVLAMQVADAERTAPEFAPVLATTLMPEIQDQALDDEDPTNRARAREARVAADARSRALW